MNHLLNSGIPTPSGPSMKCGREEETEELFMSEVFVIE